MTNCIHNKVVSTMNIKMTFLLILRS